MKRKKEALASLAERPMPVCIEHTTPDSNQISRIAVSLDKIRPGDLVRIVTQSDIHNPREWLCLVKGIDGQKISGLFVVSLDVREEPDSIDLDEIRTIDIYARNAGSLFDDFPDLVTYSV